MPDKSRSQSRLRRQLEELARLSHDRTANSDEFSKWYRATRVAVTKTFGDGSAPVSDFTAIHFSPPIATEKTTDADRQWWYENGFRKARTLLEGLLAEIEEYWDDEAVVSGTLPNVPTVVNTPTLKLFISHRSTDRLLAKALADLFRDALRLNVTDIRCTSVDGYRLQGGADTATQLRHEILGASAFVGLITPTTMESPYVLFELGARWGVGSHLCPVLGRGADDKSLGGPLGGKNALHLTARAEIVQMIEEIAATLNQRLESWTAVQHEIDEVIRLASDVVVTRSDSAEPNTAAEIQLDTTELRILTFLATDEGSGASSAKIADALRLGVEKVRYYLRGFEQSSLVDYVENWATRERYYSLDQPGRELLMTRDLL